MEEYWDQCLLLTLLCDLQTIQFFKDFIIIISFIRLKVEVIVDLLCFTSLNKHSLQNIAEIMYINVDTSIGENIQQKMIIYSKYEKLQETVEEQKQIISILTQKVSSSVI